MKTNKLLLIALCLALGSLLEAFAEESTLTPFPGAEYKGTGKRREFHEIPVAELIEGSPEWVYRQLMIFSKAMNFDELSKYQSPAHVRAARRTSPEAMAALTAVKLDDVLRVGDSKLEENRGYVYMGFKNADGMGGWSLGYVYFLKEKGKWIVAGRKEWQRGVMDPVPN